MDLPLLNELNDLYARMHAEIESLAPVCQISGRCCRFKEYDHTLFLSAPEADLLMSEGLPPSATIDEDSCPFQINGLCTAREKRPLGCRVYFCDPTYENLAGPIIAEKYTAEMKQMHTLHGIGWEYRPLHEHLRLRSEADNAG